MDTLFEDIFGIFRQAFEDAKTYIDETISEQLDSLPGEMDVVIQNVQGDLGLIDPNQARSEIADTLAQSLEGDLAQSDRVYAATETANDTTWKVKSVQHLGQ